MTDKEKMSNARRILRDMKISRIISEMSQMYNLSLEDAMEIFYNTDTADMIKEGVADIHCRSEKYLAQCVWEEHMKYKPEYFI